MPVFERCTELPVTAAVAYAWHARDGALTRLAPPGLQVLWSRGAFEERHLAMRPGFGQPLWHIIHEDAVIGRKFVDRQVRGPMRHWRHEHMFEPHGPDRCLLVDRIEWEFPVPPVGRWLAGRWLGGMLHRMFVDRHRITRDDLAQHAQWEHVPRRSVVLLGCGSWIGDAVWAYLSTAGHRVCRYTGLEPAGTQRLEPADVVLDMRALASKPGKGHNSEGLDDVMRTVRPAVHVVATQWPPQLQRELPQSDTIRHVCLCVGVVVPDRAGLQPSLPQVRGPQPWIALQDLLGIVEAAMCDAQWRGSVDVAAPQRMDPRELPALWARPRWPVGPRLGLLSHVASESSPEGQALQRFGYRYRYPDLAGALTCLASPAANLYNFNE